MHGRLSVLLLLAALLPRVLPAEEIVTVAVASNFAKTATAVAAAFTENTGVTVRISSGSTGKLYAQIINGAPFDIFLSADARRSELLEQSGLIVSGSRSDYAIGRLVLWSRDEKLRGKDCRDVLRRVEYSRLALANPGTAPYGEAAREVLQAVGLWASASERAVFGENIAQTLQFAATGNATLAFVARSQLKDPNLPEATCAWTVPESLHATLHQQLVLLKRARSNVGARRFVEFLGSPAAKEIIRRHGYRVAM